MNPRTLLLIRDDRAGSPARSGLGLRFFRHAGPLFALLLLLALGLAAAPMADAQSKKSQFDPITTATLFAGFNRGMEAFQKRDWKVALAEMDKVITLYEKYPDKEAVEAAKQDMAPAYYVVGAAAFNVPDYPKAIAAFGRFMTLYPKHERLPHARLAVARATYLNGEFAKAAKLFEAMEQYPSLREQSLIIQAKCLKESNKIKQMIAVVERLIADGITTSGRAGAALLLAQARLTADADEKLAPLLDQLLTRRHLVENVVELNAVIVGLGDLQMAKEQFEKASRTYLQVMPPPEVIAFQKQRIETLERRIAVNKAAAAAPHASQATLLSIAGQNAELQTVLDEAKELLADFEKIPDYMPGLLLRNARCWYGRDMKWESILVHERLLALYPTAAKEREAALFGNVIAYADLMQVKPCQQQCEQYLKEFPQGDNAGTVAYVLGAVAIQAGDTQGAAKLFEAMIEAYPKSSFIDQMYLLLGGAYVSLGELDKALPLYARYISLFPEGSAVEEFRYRGAIIPVFQGHYEQGWKELEAFLKQYPASPFAGDAAYRLMICKYAAKLYDEVLADMEKWKEAHPTDSTEPEVLALKGDCLAAQMKTKEAADAYQAAARSATNDEVLNYALNEASKLLKKLGDTAQLSQMWENFIKQRPEHFSVVVGIYWISQAKTREGKVAEAKEITVTQLSRCLNQYKNECVEMLLQQLAQLCWKRPRINTPPPAPAPAPVLDKDGKPVPQPEAPAPPPLPPWDAMAELDKQLAPLNAIADESGRQRLAFARMELLKILKKQAEADTLMRGISASPPELLSPQLLALAGEFHQHHERDAEATVYYNFLKENYLRSAWLDYAYAGLAAMELAKGNKTKAIELYTLAVDEYGGAKVKDSTLGLAMAMLESERYPEARKLFEQVASTREWRGESTAEAVFYLGLVEERQGNLAEAIAYYQRVFVAYQKYRGWAGKAYIKCALCFDKLGKRKEGIAHLREALRNEKLDPAVLSEARELLKQWGASF